MEIKGKITIFPESVKVGEETKIITRGTISSKDQEGNYVNKSVKVKLSGDKFPQEKINKLSVDECYELEVQAGFLGVESWKKGDEDRREVCLVVTAGKLLGHKPVNRKTPEEQVDANLPF